MSSRAGQVLNLGLSLMSCTRGKGRPEWEWVLLWLAVSRSSGWDFCWGPRQAHCTLPRVSTLHVIWTSRYLGEEGNLDKGYCPQDSQHNWEFQGVESTFFIEDGLALGRLLTAIFLCGSSKPGGWAYLSIRDQLLILSTHSPRSTLRNELGGFFVSHSETFRSLNKVFKAPFDYSLPSSASSFSGCFILLQAQRLEDFTTPHHPSCCLFLSLASLVA